MSKLIPVIIVCMLLAELYERNSKIDSKNKSLFYIIVVILVLFAGLRVRYNDTATYIDSYNNMNQEISWLIGDNPAFQITNMILKMLGISANGFIMFYSIITLSIYLWFIRKYSNDFPLSLFIMLAGGVYLFSFAAIKQTMAMAIGLLGIDAAIQKKWFKFIFLIFIAMLFHTYILMFLITPILFFKPWTFKSYILIGISLLTGILFQSMLGRVLSITSLVGENYNISLFNGEGVNIFRLLVTIAPVALSFITKEFTKYEENRIVCLMINMTTVNAAIMFISLFGTAFYLARIANYFAIFPLISIPYILNYFTESSKKFLKTIVFIGFSGFLFYACGINRGFDVMYERISIFQFLNTLFS